MHKEGKKGFDIDSEKWGIYESRDLGHKEMRSLRKVNRIETAFSPQNRSFCAMNNVVGFLSIAIALVVASSDGRAAELPPVRIAYFVPRDREPIPGYPQRVDRVMQEVQRFYREGMNAAGYGPMTFALERSSDAALVVHLVQGKEPMAHSVPNTVCLGG